MDDIRERLRRLQRAYNVTRGSGQGDDKSASIREQLERMDKRRSWGQAGLAGSSGRPRPLRLDDVLRGREVSTPLGTCYELKAAYRTTYRHGDHCIGAFCDTDLSALNLFCGGGDSSGVGANDFLFMDLETTGLSLGAGTYVFLVGLGYFREGRYHVHQVFLRDFDEEPAALYHTRKLMEPFRTLVTFNGKRFDIPLLEARFTMCSQPATLRYMTSWDLLYPARRLWYDRLENCRLGTIERERLGVAREGLDIPGDQIPRLYFDYIHDRDARDLDRVAYHNAMDVLTLTTLAVHIDRSLGEKDPVRSNLFSVGRYYERKGIHGLGEEYFEVVSCRGSSPREKDRALLHLARQRKRAGRIEDALRIWQGLIEGQGYGTVDGCVEMAKHLEHRTRDYDEAIKVVSNALVRVRPDQARLRGDLEKRLERLNRKKGKVCAQDP